MSSRSEGEEELAIRTTSGQGKGSGGRVLGKYYH